MAIRICFEEKYVKRTLDKSKKNDLAIIDPDGIDNKIIGTAVNRGVHVYGYFDKGGRPRVDKVCGCENEGSRCCKKGDSDVIFGLGSYVTG